MGRLADDDDDDGDDDGRRYAKYFMAKLLLATIVDVGTNLGDRERARRDGG